MKKVELLIPALICFFGVYLTFYQFWHGFDAITGDLGDARFNAYVLEHTWLWLQGTHASLFDLPMFYPHTNTYAYSDFMLGFAPIYWFFRAIDCEILLSYQWWMIVCSVLNFGVFHWFLKRFFHLDSIFAAIGAFVFAYSLPRVTHLEHAQLLAQFFIVLSAAGALLWWKEPTSKKAPWLFCIGAILQFISAFYFFWFWTWTLSVYAVYVAWNRERRQQFIHWFKQVPKVSAMVPFVVCGALVLPFLYHYALTAMEFGRRDWVTISSAVPRLYSWINLPTDHWQWGMVPFKNWISALPMIHEHYLSFGLLTWIGMICSLSFVYRRKPQLKFLALPLIAMFVFTITSGRFSTWVLVSYLFPGGGAVRAVSRIQVFMLMFWAVIFILTVSEFWNSKQSNKKGLAFFMILALFTESTYLSEWTFSRSEERQRLEKISSTIPADCELIVNQNAFLPNSDFLNIDMVMIAFQTNRITANGYSGNVPKKYGDVLNQLSEISKFKKVCHL